LSVAELLLCEPEDEWFVELGGYIAAFRDAGISHIPGLLPDQLLDDPATLLRKNREWARSENLPDGWVPASTWLAVQHGRMVGNINLRHRLTPFLEKLGGHIGYSVHPQHWKKGYATRMLALTLPKAKQLGLERVLITCDDTNVGSMRVIEKNGGKLEDKIAREGGGLTRRYWLDV
jgi:predicted acetyltransferase